jgi:hypothetical protein
LIALCQQRGEHARLSLCLDALSLHEAVFTPLDDVLAVADAAGIGRGFVPHDCAEADRLQLMTSFCELYNVARIT